MAVARLIKFALKGEIRKERNELCKCGIIYFAYNKYPRTLIKDIMIKITGSGR